jgi:hypothetical protein
MKWKFWLLAVAVCIAVLVGENRFLFSFRSVRVGMDEAQVSASLGEPWIRCSTVKSPGLSEAQWKNSIGCDGEDYWRYVPNFFGIHPLFGEWQVKFHQGKVVRTSAEVGLIGYQKKWPELPLKLPSGETVLIDSTNGMSAERHFFVRYQTAIPSRQGKELVAQMKEVVRAFQDQADKAGITVMILTPLVPPEPAGQNVDEVVVHYDTRKTASGGVEIVPVPVPKKPHHHAQTYSYEIRKMPSGEWRPPNGFPW